MTEVNKIEERLQSYREQCFSRLVYRSYGKVEAVEDMDMGDMKGVFTSRLRDDVLPTQWEFIEAMLSQFGKSPASGDDIAAGIKGRAARTWASFVRELMLDCLLKIEFNGAREFVISSKQLDQLGYDFIIMDHGRLFAVQSLADTKESIEAAERKDSRHPPAKALPRMKVFAGQKNMIGSMWVNGPEDAAAVRAWTRAPGTKVCHGRDLPADLMERIKDAYNSES